MDTSKIILLLLLLLLLICIVITIQNNKVEEFVNFSSLFLKNFNEYSYLPLKLIKDIPSIILYPYKILSGIDNPYNTPSRYVIEFLAKYGQYRIIGLQLCRSPLASVIRNLFNYATTGKFNEQLKIRGMDDIFHLWLNITLTNGIDTFTIKTEKTSIVEFSDKDLIAKDCFVIEDIPNDNQLTLNQFFENAIKIHPFDFYLYDGRNNNCQEYVRSLLKGSGYLSEEANEFLYQNAEELFNNLGYSGKIVGNFVKILSNLAANITRYVIDK
jgi:hypothetical protein